MIVTLSSVQYLAILWFGVCCAASELGSTNGVGHNRRNEVETALRFPPACGKRNGQGTFATIPTRSIKPSGFA